MADGRPQRDWRAGAAVPIGGPDQAKTPLFLAGVIAVALIGAIFGLVYWLLAGGERPVRLIAIPLSEHTHHAWPPVPFAEKDANLLVKQFPGGEVAFNDQEAELFVRRLASLKSLGDRPLFLSVSGLVVVHEGKPYLLSSKAAPGAPDANWHLLDDVLDAVAACPAKEKLLLLDVIHPVAAANRGVLADIAGAAVHARLKARADEKKLSGLVMVTCSPGEFAHAHENAGATALVHFFGEALQGEADGYADGTRDSWVKVREAFAYTRDHVARWAYFTRGVTQTVNLYGDGDFRLAPCDARREETEATTTTIAYPAWLTETWTIRDGMDSGGARVKAPQLLHRLNTATLRAEARFRLGASADKVKRELFDTRGEVVAAWEKYKTVVPPPKTSLIGTPAPTALLGKIEGWLAAFDGKKKLADVLGEMKVKPEDVLLAAWLRLAETTLPRDQVAGLCGEANPPGSRPEQAEGVFLLKLGELATKRAFVAKDRDWPDATVHAAVKAEQATLEAVTAALAAPEVFRWLRARFEALDKERVAAETVLWTLGDEGVVGATSAAANVAAKYKEIEKQARDIRDDALRAALAWRAWTDAAAELPWIADTLPMSSAGGAIEQWRQAAISAMELADGFDRAEQPAGFGQRLSGPTAVVTDAMKSLRAYMAGLEQRDPDGKVAPAVFNAPGMNAKERTVWWEKWQKWIASKETWLGENETQTKVSDLPTPAEWTIPEADRAELRAKLTLDLARLAGQSVGGLASQTAELAVKRDPAVWSDLGPKLLTVYLPPGDTVSAVTDRTGRVFGTTDAPARAAARVRKEFWSYLVERYESEARFRGLTRLPFYLKAAQDARAAADVARAAAGS